MKTVSQYILWKIYYFRYCRSSTIRKDANNKNIKVIFKSDRKTSGTGAQCNIKCIDPQPTTTTTSTTSTTTTTTTTISFTGWVYLKLCHYKWISQKWKLLHFSPFIMSSEGHKLHCYGWKQHCEFNNCIRKWIGLCQYVSASVIISDKFIYLIMNIITNIAAQQDVMTLLTT